MSTLKPTRKISRKEKLREDTVATLYAKAVDFFDRNRNVVYGSLAAVAVLIVALVGWSYMKSQKEATAAEEIAAAVRNYELGLYREALDGVAGSKGLITVSNEYSGTDAGNLAKFYAADALFRLGEYDEALGFFRSYKKESDYLGASALAGEASILEMKGQPAEAARLYERAADTIDDELTTAQYLIDAGRSYEAAGMYDRAVRTYQRVADDFSAVPVSRDAEFLVARARAGALSAN